MIPILVFAMLAALFVLFLVVQAWQWRSSEGAVISDLTPIDLEAFENLIDPDEETYLRANLPAAEFRAIQRSRIRVAKMYISVISNNATILAAVGQAARNHADENIAASGIEILNRAMRLKMWCLLALVRLNSAWIFPTQVPYGSDLASPYLVVKGLAASLPEHVAA